MWNDDKCNTSQSSRDKIYITLTIYIYIYNGKNESKKRVERIKDKENERRREISFLLREGMGSSFIGFPNDFH